MWRVLVLLCVMLTLCNVGDSTIVCDSFQLTDESARLLTDTVSSSPKLLNLVLNLTAAVGGQTTALSAQRWVYPEGLSLLNILPASRFYTVGAITADFAFLQLNLTGADCSSVADVERAAAASQQRRPGRERHRRFSQTATNLENEDAIFEALYPSLAVLDYDLCQSFSLSRYRCCTRVGDNSTCLVFLDRRVAIFPVTLQIGIAAFLACFFFRWIFDAVRRWRHYGIIQQNAEVVTCPALHLLLFTWIARRPRLYRHVTYWAQILTFGLACSMATVYATMQPTAWPAHANDPLARPRYADRPTFVIAILMPVAILLTSIACILLKAGPSRVSLKSASVFLFACRRKLAGSTWWQFFSFVQLINVSTILGRVVSRWLWTAMLLILLSLGILLFYDSSDFSTLIGITLTTIMPLIPRLAQTATPIVLEFERGYLRERVTEVFAAIDSDKDVASSHDVAGVHPSSSPTTLRQKKRSDRHPADTSSDRDDDDDKQSESHPLLQQQARELFLQDLPSEASLLSSASPDPFRRVPNASVQHRHYQREHTVINMQAPTYAIMGVSESADRFLRREWEAFLRLITLDVKQEALCVLSAVVVGFGEFFILLGFTDPQLRLISDNFLRLFFWSAVLSFSALRAFQDLPSLGPAPEGMGRVEWLLTVVWVILVQAACLLSADALSNFVWSWIAYSVVYPSPGLPVLGFILALLSSFIILSNELTGTFRLAHFVEFIH